MDIDTRNEDGWSALRFAARCQNREAAQFLSDHGAKSDIFVAAALGDKQAVENSLKLQPDLVFANDGYGAQPLHWAAEFSYPELVDLLLQVGAKAKSSDHWGSTALHFTAQKGRDGCVEVATLLLDHGAKIDALDHDGKTPLHLAVRRRRLDLVKFLLARGARARTQDKTLGCTPLHSAVERANEDALPSISVLELLLRAGADVNVRNEFGETPLGVALRCEQTQIADFLRQRGGIE
jgi:ankyrin repeat protein